MHDMLQVLLLQEPIRNPKVFTNDMNMSQMLDALEKVTGDVWVWNTDTKKFMKFASLEDIVNYRSRARYGKYEGMKVCNHVKKWGFMLSKENYKTFKSRYGWSYNKYHYISREAADEEYRNRPPTRCGGVEC